MFAWGRAARPPTPTHRVCDNTLLDGVIRVDSAVTRVRAPLRASAESAGRRRVPLLIAGMFALGGEVYQ